MPKTMQERCLELLPVIQAGAEGNVIQRYFSESDSWSDCGPCAPVFDQFSQYRVKPVPTHRPYKPAEAVHLLETWIRGQDCCAYDVVAIEKTGVRLGNQELMPYDLLLERFTVRHTHPCGVLVES